MVPIREWEPLDSGIQPHRTCGLARAARTPNSSPRNRPIRAPTTSGAAARWRGHRTSGGSSSIYDEPCFSAPKHVSDPSPLPLLHGLGAIGAVLPPFWWGFRRVLWLWLGGCGHGVGACGLPFCGCPVGDATPF